MEHCREWLLNICNTECLSLTLSFVYCITLFQIKYDRRRREIR